MTSVELEYRAQVLRIFLGHFYGVLDFSISNIQYAFIVIAQKKDRLLLKRSKLSFLSVLILQNEAEKPDNSWLT